MAITQFDALRRLSAEVGADPLLVQAAGGNTSIKDDALMRIKASGTWLADALTRDIFVDVDLPRLRRALANDHPDCETPHRFTAASDTSGLRPSIETTVHALMPERVVVHVHCVETIASVIATNAEDSLKRLLGEFRWAFIPYARPGLPLARAIATRLQPGIDVLILGNHGLVVAAETVEDAAILLLRVQAALRRVPRPPPQVDLAAMSARIAGSDYRLPQFDEVHAPACDPVSLSVARQGTLYPDHVVFLGPGIRVVKAGEALPLDAPRMLVFAGLGVALHESAGASAQAMARCLSGVAARTDASAILRVLTTSEEAELLDWDAEKYRQALAKQMAAASSPGLMRG